MQSNKKVETSSLLILFSHLLIWLLLLHLGFNLLGLFHSFITLFIDGEREVDEAFLMIPFLIGLFYWNSYYLIPRFLNRKFWWKYLLGLSISSLVLFYFGNFLFDVFARLNYTSRYDEMDFFDQSLFLYLITIGISSSLGISKIALKNAAQKKEAEQKQKEAELKYLNAQFNPHFLYNTLNGIYAQAVEEDAPKTTEAILKLSEIMRYPINHGLKNKVALTDEMAFIEGYISLQKLRLGDDYPIIFEKKGKLDFFEIIPFILMPLVENAFKYGVSQRDKTPILFQLNVNNDQLHFLTENKITNMSSQQSHLIGIKNLKQRLDIVYGEDYTLDLQETDGRYLVELKLNRRL